MSRLRIASPNGPRARHARALLYAALYCSFGFAQAAAACVNTRPTTPSAAWSYADDTPLASYVSPDGLFRVWYATAGDHAPADVDPKTGDASTVPASVISAAAIATNAQRYFSEQLGLVSPTYEIADGNCENESADGILDIYLLNFGGSADGTVQYDACSTTVTGQTCPGYVILENDFAESHYPSLEQAQLTVLPHEYFHLIQGAYSADMADWWAEGTAQWAADAFTPELTDLESYLPAYLTQTDRPLDLPPATAAQPFSYGAALFPLFLQQAFETEAVRATFEEQRNGVDEFTALEAVLQGYASSLGDAFSLFARWNAATGARATSGIGYTDAALYPEVAAQTFEAAPGASLSSATTGLSAHYYAVTVDKPVSLLIDADAERTQAWLVPLVAGRAQLDQAVPLPTTVSNDALLVVSGTSTRKSDAAYRVSATSPSSVDAAACDTETEDADSPQLAEEGGCSITHYTQSHIFGFCIFGLGWICFCVRRRSSR